MKLLSIFALFVSLIYAVQGQPYRGTVRLVRSGNFSSSYTAGIVQIYYGSNSSSNSWGNICFDSSFGSTEANVICNQLGYNGASTYGSAGSTTSYGTDTAATVLNDVNCVNSNYLTLQQCSLSTVIKPSCISDNEDLYVSCRTTRIWDSPDFSGQIRLVGGNYSSYGRLEVYCNGEWGTVCADSFGPTGARTACRQLGYSDYSTYNTNVPGSSSQHTWFENLACNSSSNCLGTCESCPTTQISFCGSGSRDVALGCEFDSSYATSNNTPSTCEYAGSRRPDRGTVRLFRNGVFSSSYSAGIVEIYYAGSSYRSVWGNICDDSSFGYSEANVICHQLGYNGVSTYGRAGDTTSYGTDTAATALNDVSCSNSDYLTLEQCSLSTVIKSSCTSDSEDVYVSCYTTRIWNNPYAGQIRLQGGNYSSYGRLEVYCNGQWGTVCDDDFYDIDAQVACQQLGYSDYSTYAPESLLVGPSSQPIWFERVYCVSLDVINCLASCHMCPSSTPSSSCEHSEDVVLGCQFSNAYTASSNTVSSCQNANDRVNIGAIIGGVIAGIFVCCVLIITVPICISCCLGFGISAGTRGN